MKKPLFLSLLKANALAFLPRVGPAQQVCAVNSLGQVICAPPAGGAATNSLGQVICATNVGSAAKNSLGQAVYTGDCVPGR